MTDIQQLRRGLHMLTEGESSRVARSLKPKAETLRIKSAPWTEGKGIQGMGIGQRVSGGQRHPDLVLKVYVEKKLPKSKIINLVPSKVSIPGIEDKIKIDVEEIGRVEIEPNTIKTRPANPGFGVGHPQVSVGTFGCLCRRNGDEKGLYILSNSHVLANQGLGKKGDAIVQPGIHDGGQITSDVIAELFDWVPFEFTEMGHPNKVDAAIAKVKRGKSSVNSAIRKIGIPLGLSTTVRRGMQVQKTGRTTDYTIGEITDTDYRLALNYKRTRNRTARVGISDQVLCTRYTAGGDSGSVVMNMKKKVVGLHFAGSPSSSIFNKIENVIDALDITIVTSEL